MASITGEVLELGDDDSAAVSSASTIRIRGNSRTGAAEVSVFGGAYAAIGGGSVLLPADDTTYSFVNNLIGSGSESMGSASSFTQAVAIMPLRERTMTGVRFWSNLTSAVDFKVSLWEAGAGSRLAQGTATVGVGAGFYEISFATPYVISAAEVGTEMRISLYHTSGTEYPRTTSTGGFVPATPFVAGVYIQSSFNLFGAGDSYPTSVAGSDFYALEPVFAKVSP